MGLGKRADLIDFSEDSRFDNFGFSFDWWQSKQNRQTSL